MSLDHLLQQLSHAQTLSELDRLLDRSTLKGILNCWLFDCIQENYSRKTLSHYENKVVEFLDFLGTEIITPDQVTDNQVKFFLTKKKDSRNSNTGKLGHKDWTMHGYYRAIHRYFEYMVDKKILKHSPMEGMKPPKVAREIIKPYSEEQIGLMLKLCEHGEHFTGIRNKAMLLLYLSTGLRKAEMCEIELDHVNIVKRTIQVMGKGAKERVVGFGERAKKALMDYCVVRAERVKNESPYLWITEEGERLGYHGISLSIYDLKIRAQINIRSSTHALRHSFATQMLRNGARLNDVQALMGHATADMTLKYAATVDSWDAVKNHPKFDPVDNWKL
jgi:site-specific recombinase XerD